MSKIPVILNIKLRKDDAISDAHQVGCECCCQSKVCKLYRFENTLVVWICEDCRKNPIKK